MYIPVNREVELLKNNRTCSTDNVRGPRRLLLPQKTGTTFQHVPQVSQAHVSKTDVTLSHGRKLIVVVRAEEQICINFDADVS